MRTETSSATILQWIKEKQALETELAWELLEVFNSPPLITGLRGLAHLAVAEMDGLKNGGGTGQEVFMSAWNKEKDLYYVVKERGSWEGIVAGVDGLLAQHCGELIRLYGEVVEAGKNKGLREYQDLDAARLGYQKDTQPGFHWVKKEGGGRQRTQSPSAMKAPGSGDKKRHVAYAEQQGYVWDFLESMGGGIKVWELKDTSTIYKIDKVFGLVAAADISGTTTDCVFFLNRFNQGGLDPMFYLLPAANIVAGAHHSLLEVAAALTLNKCCSYSIGLYSTLFPTDSRVNDAGSRGLKKALEMAESDPRNRLMLIYYNESGQIAGCRLFEDQDKDKFRQLARADLDLLDIFRRFRHWPSEVEVQQLMLLNRKLATTLKH